MMGIYRSDWVRLMYDYESDEKTLEEGYAEEGCAEEGYAEEVGF